MARFHNDTGSPLNSQEFGRLPHGEFEIDGYDPDVHGVIPGCTRLDAPPEDPAAQNGGTPDGGPGDDGPAAQAGDGRASRKRAQGAAEPGKEIPA